MPLNDYAPIFPWVGTAVALLYAVCVTYKASKKGGPVNKDIQKDCEKVVHLYDIEDLGDKSSFCRCWKSAKFPYCDGSHARHNRECGDNLGPVVIKRKA